MPSTRTYNRSFAGGVISPEMFGRIDDSKFQSGAAVLRNFIATPTGAAENRPGFAYVSATKNSGVARLIPFTYSLNQTMVIELGNLYARFHTQGATLKYSATQPAYVPATTVSVSVASPCVVTWTAHGFTGGEPVMFGPGPIVGPPPYPPYYLPTGLDAYKIYTVAAVTTNTFQLIDPASGNPVAVTVAGAGNIYGHRSYTAGDLVTYSGAVWYAPTTGPGGTTPTTSSPDVDHTVGGPQCPVFYQLPADLTYEIPTPYAAADLFDIHYAQSADVMTLVHRNYAPQELRRLSATAWTLASIAFGPPLAAPGSVAVAASPGFKAAISTITLANPALITTASNHTLTLGDGIYINNLTATIGGVATVLDGFYMVDKVPADTSGNLILNQLNVMDYSGNVLDSSGWSAYAATDGSKPISIQYGSKIFNIDSYYAVQAIGSDGVSGSALSGSAHVVNNLNVPGAYNTVSWAAAASAQNYYVYKQFNGLWGYIGSTTGLQFVDNNIAPDMSITPGNPDAVFSSAGNYPGAVCYFEQRRCFAGTANAPQNAWMTNTGTESMFSYSLPSRATDRIAFRVAALQADVIQHMVPMLQLILLTSQTEFALLPVNSDAITPSSLSVKPQSYIGASNVQPTIINTSMVYAASRGGHVRELGYAWTVQGYQTGDVSLRAAHLFDNLSIVDQAYAKSPLPIIWFVSSNGKLLGLTYIPEEQLGAWHEHTTDGSFESVAVVAEGSEDVLYAVINRTINGATVRYVERMAPRLFDTLQDAFFVDAGITQTFSPAATAISGLTWLEGCTVAVLADGAVQTQKTVVGGAITLDHAASVVQIGLPYVSDLKTLPLVLQLDGFGQGLAKNVNKVWLKVYRSSGIMAGPDKDHMIPFRQRTTEPYGSPPALLADSEDAPEEVGPIVIPPSWASGSIYISQADPLPLSVVAVTMEVAIGG